MQDVITGLKGVHEPQEEVVFHRLLNHLPDEANRVEIGAFWAHRSISFMSEQSDVRRGVALEMDPAHIAVGQRNAALNGLEIEFILGRISDHNAPEADFETESSGMQNMPAADLAGLMDHTGLPRVDLLLCDAQGGEIDMLKGMKPLMDNKRLGIALISTHHHAIAADPLTHQRTLRLVAALGRRVALEHDVAESFSGDGLVVADFGGLLSDWQPPEISRCRAGNSLFRNPLYNLAEAQEKAAADASDCEDRLHAARKEAARLTARIEQLEKEVSARHPDVETAQFSFTSYLKHRRLMLGRSIAKRLGK